ncbi:MAG TPA: LAGLIDADG family homing endonuclease, partial [Tahibacter sp.]|nr:LAGLIDADG family homing endonuclease [Tahibacter sp.]
MSTVRLAAVARGGAAIPMQPASYDIWDRKYRLRTKLGEPVDQSIDHSYQRIAKALSDVEETDEKRNYWNERFLWALRHGAIPAGRITSNAGALAHKPATSTINCTVSGSIEDSMDGILQKVHEAGLTLKAGCGIGYEFSTLRPRGAYVSGAGAYTSGPMSFMDIYDKMCFTVSSAGGRRGAQMGTFDVSHPDVKDFIRAKREDGRLRQFNLSLLITDGFMQSVADDGDWPLVFPITQKETDDIDFADAAKVVWREWPITKNYVVREDGQVACKVYSHIRARHLWDMIMVSTYDYAEPGFILIDRVNEMNNNWWCENIRATNPCVTADTWVQTSQGPRQVADLIGTPFAARVDGVDHASGAEGFFKTAHKPVVALATREGYRLRLTADHRVRRVRDFVVEWCEAGQLAAGDHVLLNDHRRNATWNGALNFDEGYVLGLMVGDERLTSDSSVVFELAANGDAGSSRPYARSDRWRDLAVRVGMSADNVAITPRLEQASSEGYRGFLRGFFDVECVTRGPALRLSRPQRADLDVVQRMLLRLGIRSSIEAKPGRHELTVSGDNIRRYAEVVGFADFNKAGYLAQLVAMTDAIPNRERWLATVAGVTPDGIEDVYDVQVPGINTFDANGLHAHNCGEQPLPPYGSCLLGSVNLTMFVRDPFGP